MKTTIYLTLAFCLWSMACTPSNPDTTGTNSTAASDQATNASTADNLLIGHWQSTEDAQYTITLTQERQFISYYDDTVTSRENYTYHAACPESCNQLEGSCLSTEGEEGNFCYFIISLTEQELQLSMLGGRGNTLSFKRI